MSHGVAKDRTVATKVRRQSLFWIGQEAAQADARGLSEVALDDKEEQGVRNAAVFALSQRPPDEAIPALISVAEDSVESETRRRAMFWLAQIEDPRVVDFFEQVLLGRIR